MSASHTDTATDSHVFNILHFSDVYDIYPDEKDNGKGGAPRFLSALNAFTNQQIEPLVFFSGDFLCGSNADIACITKGQHMLDILNKCNIACGTLGNHNFDFGEQHLFEMLKHVNFPMINTNLLLHSLPNIHRHNKDEPLIHKYFIIEYTNHRTMRSLNVKAVDKNEQQQQIIADENEAKSSRDANDTDNEDEKTQKAQEQTLKIGVIGLCDNLLNKDRLDDTESVQYEDMIECAQQYISELRETHKVDMIVALTHCKVLNDRVLADKVSGIDLILGGHDRINTVEMNKNTRSLIVKSGHNFKNFSWIQFIAPPHLNEKKKILDDQKALKVKEALASCLLSESDVFKARKYWYRVRYYEVNETLQADEEMKKLVNHIMDDYNHQRLDEPIGRIECNLDCTRFSLLNGECNAANFVTDVVRVWCKCDCVILSATSFLTTDDPMDIPDINIPDQKVNDDVFSASTSNFNSISNFNIDGTINKGKISARDIMNKLYTDKAPIIVLELTGEQIRAIIEHGLSKKSLDENSNNDDSNDRKEDDNNDENEDDAPYNELLNGVNKFPHVSGLRFVYDPIDENGKKLKSIWIIKYDEVGTPKYEELQDNNVYSVATSLHLANGGDGYAVFQDPVSIIRDEEDSMNAHMILIDFFRKITELNNTKILNVHATGKNKVPKKEILKKIHKLQLSSKSLASCIETKWVSSVQAMSGHKSSVVRFKKVRDLSHDLINPDDEDYDDDEIVTSPKSHLPSITPLPLSEDSPAITPPKYENADSTQSPEPDANEPNKETPPQKHGDFLKVKLENDAEDEDSNVELGGTENTIPTPVPDAEEDNLLNSNKKNAEESDVELQHTEKMSLKEKLMHLDTEAMKEKFIHFKMQSQSKLNIMGEKLKKMAKESQEEMEKLAEKAQHFMHKQQHEVKHDAEGNVLDVEVFVVKPKTDNRIMTCDDEKRWLKLKSESVANILYNSDENQQIEENVLNNFVDDEMKQRLKTSEEIEDAANGNRPRTESKARLFVRRKSSELFQKIGSKKAEFDSKRKGKRNANGAATMSPPATVTELETGSRRSVSVDSHSPASRDNDVGGVFDAEHEDNKKKKKMFPFKGFGK